MKTGIIMATKLEASPFISRLNLKKTGEKKFPIYENDTYILVISGIGKTCAATATSYCISTFNISTLVNLGAAGAVKPGFTIGESFQVDKIIEYDRPRLLGPGLHTHKPDYFKELGSVSLSTQDKPVIDNDERFTVSRYADLVDMEAAAFVQACKTFKARAYVYKFVSDTMNDNSAAIIYNIKKYRDSLFEYFQENVLPRISR